MQKVAILITSYNSKEQALRCLDGCYHQEDSLAALGEYQFDIWMMDDGSTDGTAEAVSEAYPGVHLTRGLGDLYWTQGMRAIWVLAAQSEAYDFYLWLNPLTTLRDGAFGSLLENARMLGNKAIVAGTGVDAEGRYSFGGIDKSGRIMTPDKTVPIPCHTFNGNLVLVPKSVYQVLGNLSEAYRHCFGDFDYGVRAVKSGVPRVVAPGVLAQGKQHTYVPYWRDASIPLVERYRYLQSPKGRPFRESFVYDCRSKGLLYAVWHFISTNFMVLFPKRERHKGDEKR